jgi:hypothetical protein
MLYDAVCTRCGEDLEFPGQVSEGAAEEPTVAPS